MSFLIKVYGSPVLRNKAELIDRIDDTHVTLVKNMFETMFSTPNGVGLAAPQVGVSKQLIVLAPPGGEFPQSAIINPKIIGQESDQSGEEACLSIPGITGNVNRAYWVKIAGVALNGETVSFEAEGFLARLLQHEIDHLKGVLFVDRLGPVRKKMLERKLKKLADLHGNEPATTNSLSEGIFEL